MKKCYFKKWSYALAFMGLLLLMSGTSWAETPQYLIVSGITEPATANGIYVKQVGTTGLNPNWESWKHESQNYFIYADDYSGEYFWNIDNNLIDDDDAFFYSDGEHDASFISNLKSPDLV